MWENVLKSFNHQFDVLFMKSTAVLSVSVYLFLPKYFIAA